MKGLKLTRTAKLSEAEWQTLRRSFVDKGMVGGSDASTLLGLNKYKSSINMFYQSMGIGSLPDKMNAQMLHGKQLEEYVSNCWKYYDGTDEGWIANTIAKNKIKDYRRTKAIIENPKYPMLFANIDGRITRHPEKGKIPGILEIKTISGYAADMYEAGIPPGYLIQLQHYLLVTGLSWGEICYLKDGRDLGVVTFDADPNLQGRILSAATDFYERVRAAKEAINSSGAITEDEKMQVAQQFEPEADGSDAFNQFISERHKARENELTIQGDTDIEVTAHEYVNISDSIRLKESEKQLAQNKIKQYMEKHGATMVELPGGGKVTWRKQFLIKL